MTTRKRFFGIAGRAVFGTLCLQAGLLLLPVLAFGASGTYDNNSSPKNSPSFLAVPNNCYYLGDPANPLFSNNIVTIAYDTALDLFNVYGGVGNSDSAVGNTVYIHKTSANGIDFAYGGFSETGNVTGNRVVMYKGKAIELIGGQVGWGGSPAKLPETPCISMTAKFRTWRAAKGLTWAQHTATTYTFTAAKLLEISWQAGEIMEL